MEGTTTAARTATAPETIATTAAKSRKAIPPM
jgi:hypothetical protein